MKKSTILIIVVVFAVSVFVVGIFGMQNVPYNEYVYVNKITPTSVSLSNDTIVSVRENELGYYIVVPYEQDIRILIDYKVEPEDATNRHLSVTIDNINENSNAELLENGAIQLHDSGVVKVTYRATDAVTGPSMVIYIYTK